MRTSQSMIFLSSMALPVKCASHNLPRYTITYSIYYINNEERK